MPNRLSNVAIFSLVLATASYAAPTLSMWQSLNRTVGGRLQVATPFSMPCFSSANLTSGRFEHSATECASVIDHYLDRVTRLNTFGSFQNTQWETCQATSQDCLLDSDNPDNSAAFSPPQVCQQGSIAPYYIKATSVSDVIASFNFSRATKVPLTIKNTGHDYSGRSSGAGSLSIWTRGFSSVSYNAKFVPKGCPASKAASAVTLGAGTPWGDVYDFAEANGITVPGGADRTVGAAGGYIMGGGHSILTNLYGLGVDRVMEFEVVTPNGQHVFANDCQNQDLFFALRGGGGSTFGVVLSVSTLALSKLTIPTIFAEIPQTPDIQKKFLSFMTDHTLDFMNQGWAGYLNPFANLIFANPSLNTTAAIASIAPLKTFVTETLGGNFSMTIEPSYLNFYNRYLLNNQVPIGLPISVGSRLVPKKNFATTQSRSQLVDTTLTALQNATLPLIFLVSPIVYGDKGGTSVTPAWRSSPWHVTASFSWNFDTPLAERQQVWSHTSHAFDQLRSLTPGSGAYVLEADTYEPDWQFSFWGSNYNQLLKIKNKYDPDHLLDCWRCVGWLGESNSRYGCYSPKQV